MRHHSYDAVLHQDEPFGGLNVYEILFGVHTPLKPSELSAPFDGTDLSLSVIPQVENGQIKIHQSLLSSIYRKLLTENLFRMITDQSCDR